MHFQFTDVLLLAIQRDRKKRPSADELMKRIEQENEKLKKLEEENQLEQQMQKMSVEELLSVEAANAGKLKHRLRSIWCVRSSRSPHLNLTLTRGFSQAAGRWSAPRPRRALRRCV